MRMSRRIAALVLALVMALSLAACQGDEEPESGSKGSSSKGSSQKEDPDWPVQIGDTDIPEAPQKVVSLSPGTTEMLFEMGLGSRVAHQLALRRMRVRLERVDDVMVYFD